MNRYDIYGSKVHGLDELTDVLTKLLGVEFSAHESSHWGLHNDYRQPHGEEIRINENFIDEDGHPLEEDYPDYRTFVYISRSPRADEIAQRLSHIGGLKHLRTEYV